MDGDDQEITDPTDWLGTPLASLVGVESALRCQVCKEFYKTPMLTTCYHTFCSACIRRALLDEGKCPLCRKPSQETKLSSNWSIQDAVEAFVSARPGLIQSARNPPVPAARPTSTSPKRSLEVDEAGDETRRSSKRLRTSTRASKTRGMESTAEMARQEIDLTYEPEPESEAEPNDGLVACPICKQRMREAQVFGHLETCTGEIQQQNSARSTPANSSLAVSTRPAQQLERLPAISYSMFKEAALRKKLQELGISSQGSKAMLEKRHKEWMTLWNANCDSLDPRKKSELLRELDTWERTQGSFAPTSSKSVNQGVQIKAKDFDGAAWAAKHDNSFQNLIEQARKSRQKAQAPASNAHDGPKKTETPREVICQKETTLKIQNNESTQSYQGETSNVKPHQGELHMHNSLTNSYPVHWAQTPETPDEQARRRERDIEAQILFENSHHVQPSSYENHPVNHHQTYESTAIPAWGAFGNHTPRWDVNSNFNGVSLPYVIPEEDLRTRSNIPGLPPFHDHNQPRPS